MVLQKIIFQSRQPLCIAGQYNYARAMQRGERVAAELFLGEFIRESIRLVYLLNRRYAPFDKWSHRGMKELSTCSEIGDMIALFYQVERTEDRVLIIEAICNIIVQELNAQGLSGLEDNFLQNHLQTPLVAVARFSSCRRSHSRLVSGT